MPKSGEIKPYRGRPTIHVNGTPMTPDIYALTHATGARWSWEEVPQHNVRNFYDIGFRLFQLDFWLSDIWPKARRSTFRSLKNRFAAYWT